MFPNQMRVLVISPRHLVDRTRGLAARAATSPRRSVSLPIISRALIEERLRRPALITMPLGEASA
jgi:hypothetical protein